MDVRPLLVCHGQLLPSHLIPPHPVSFALIGPGHEEEDKFGRGGDYVIRLIGDAQEQRTVSLWGLALVIMG